LETFNSTASTFGSMRPADTSVLHPSATASAGSGATVDRMMDRTVAGSLVDLSVRAD
jgi:hypothetical protein